MITLKEIIVTEPPEPLKFTDYVSENSYHSHFIVYTRSIYDRVLGKGKWKFLPDKERPHFVFMDYSLKGLPISEVFNMILKARREMMDLDIHFKVPGEVQIRRFNILDDYPELYSFVKQHYGMELKYDNLQEIVVSKDSIFDRIINYFGISRNHPAIHTGYSYENAIAFKMINGAEYMWGPEARSLATRVEGFEFKGSPHATRTQCIYFNNDFDLQDLDTPLYPDVKLNVRSVTSKDIRTLEGMVRDIIARHHSPS